MKSAEIFNGKTFVTVHIDDEIILYGQFLNPGLQMQFTSVVGITVHGVTTNIFSDGTGIRITDIVAQDEMAQTVLTAEDVEVEVISNSAIQIPKNLSKKNLIERIAEENIDIDVTKKTKAKLYEELEGLDSVELI